MNLLKLFIELLFKATFDILFKAAVENYDAEGGIRTPVGQSPTSFPGLRLSR